MKNIVITRYAPSPTGELHIGGAKTALFSFLYARHNKGKFIIRIEDTDLNRNVLNGEESQLNNLKWLGIKPDYSPKKNPESNLGPFRQSERMEIYQEYVDYFLNKGLAYKCFCSKERLQKLKDEQKNEGIKMPKYDRKCLNHQDQEGSYVVRLKIPENKEIIWNDIVRGLITINSNDIEDWIIQRVDKTPTYNFANVIDDYLMHVTHIFRGEEHLANTPKQIILYQMLNWRVPEFAHLTIIVDENNKKLSKRNTETVQFIEEFKKNGILPEAIINFMAFLGWTSAETNEEFFSLKNLIQMFDVNRLSRSPSHFDYNKLRWFNNHYIKEMSGTKYKKFIYPFVESVDFKNLNKNKILFLFKEQLREGREIVDLVKIFTDELSYDEDQIEIINNNLKVYETLYKNIQDVKNWKSEEIEKAFKKTSDELNLTGKKLLFPIRTILTAKKVGPSLVSIIEILGKKRVLSILKVKNN